MRYVVIIACLCVVLGGKAQAGPPPLRGREVMSLDGTWRYKSDVANAGEKAEWFKAPPKDAPETVVPAEGKPGWYWREFQIPTTWKQNNLRLRLHGVGGSADYWLNGKSIGHSDLRYTPVTLDISKTFQKDRANLLAVRIAGPAAAKGTPSGLWQSVELISSDEAHISDIFVEAKTNGWTNVRVEMINVSDKTGDALLEVEVAERANPKKKVGGTYQTVRVSPGLNRAGLLFKVKSPTLWTPDTPALYTATVRLRQAKDLLDNDSETFGYREIVIREGEARLNGLPITLRTAPGPALDAAGLPTSDALDSARRSAAEFRGAGRTLLFVANRPLPERWLTAADEGGLLIVERPESSAVAAVEALVQRDRDHPSIAAWMLGAETPTDDTFSARIADLDPTRAVLSTLPAPAERAGALMTPEGRKAFDVAFDARIDHRSRAIPRIP